VRILSSKLYDSFELDDLCASLHYGKPTFAHSFGKSGHEYLSDLSETQKSNEYEKEAIQRKTKDYKMEDGYIRASLFRNISTYKKLKDKPILIRGKDRTVYKNSIS